MTWEAQKQEIAKRYCRTVLVLDDQIQGPPETDGGAKLSGKFLALKQQFSAKGIICDLQQIDTTIAAVGAGLKTCINHADVIVLDWFLGVSSKDDPNEAIEVLKTLLASGGERFVAIHSHDNADDIKEHLSGLFSLKDAGAPFVGSLDNANEIVSESETSNASASSQIASPSICRLTEKEVEGATRKSQARIHLCFLQKVSVADVAEALPETILKALESSFPDHLHWVGLEFASRIRELLPNLLATLPSGTDVALTFQALFQQDGELATDLAECLCLELMEQFRNAPLVAGTDEALLTRFIEGVKNIPEADSPKGVIGGWINQLRSLSKTSQLKEWVTNLKILNNKGKRADLNHLLQFIFETEPQTHARYAALREHLHGVLPSPARLYPGSVLRKQTTDEWMLCLTPACDCNSDAERDHLFVVGKVIADSDYGGGNQRRVSTSILHAGTTVEVQWKMSDFKTMPCSSSGPKDWVIVSRLREPFVQRIVQSLWGQQSRIGVNTSEFMRLERKEDA